MTALQGRTTGLALIVGFTLMAGLSDRANAQIQTAATSPITKIDSEMLWRAGVSVDAAWFKDFPNRVEDQPNIQSAESDDLVPGFGANLELGFTNRPFFARIDIHYGRHEFTQNFSAPTPLDPISAEGSVNGLFVDLRGGYNVYQNKKVSFGLMTGPTWARDWAELNHKYASTEDVQKTERAESGWKWNFGGEMEYGLGPRASFQLGASYTTSFKKQDADQNFR